MNQNKTTSREPLFHVVKRPERSGRQMLLFRLGAVALSKSIDLVMHMERWVEGKEYDRLGLSDEYITILGVKVPHQLTPVRPGRNMAIIIEVAARNLSLKRLGYSAAHELDRRMNEMILRKTGQL